MSRPRRFFGVIEPKRRVSRNGTIAVGLFVLAGVSLLELFSTRLGGGRYEIGAQALNSGTFIAFMGVNASAAARFWLKTERKTIANLLPPLLGFPICGHIWLKLSVPAQIVGAVQMAAGMVYGR